jgi:hypothetical protein
MSKEIELQPDGWSRFERAVDVVAKSPPQHRIKNKSKKRIAKSARSDSNPRRKQGGRRLAKGS